MFNRHRRSYLALAFVLVALSACRFGLKPDPTPEAPAAQGEREAIPTSTVPPLATPTPAPTRPATSTPPATATPLPTATQPAVATPTASVASVELPELPDAGPLPAPWIELGFGPEFGVGPESEFGPNHGLGVGSEGFVWWEPAGRDSTEPRPSGGGTFYAQTLALDAGRAVVYALGACSVDLYSTGDDPGRCISAFDLNEDRVRPPGAVGLPAEIRGESRLYAAEDVLYLYRRWAGVLHVLEAESLSVRETISGVYGIAFAAPDASGPGVPGAPYIVTPDGLSRLDSDASEPLVPAVEIPREYDDQPVEMAVLGDRVYVLVDGALHVFEARPIDARPIDARQALVATYQQEDVYLYNLAPDEANHRLYVGSYDGLYVLDPATEQLTKISADVGQVWSVTVDAAGGRLFALADRTGDWFGGIDVVSIDTTDWRTETLFTAHSGQLGDLVYDAAGDRVLVASPEDHALVPIDASASAGADIEPRLPLGLEVVEVVAGDRLYVSDSAGWVHVLDRHTYVEIDRVYGGRTISLDDTHGRLYAGDERVPVVSVYDVESLERVRVLPQPGKPRANPITGEVVIVHRKFYVYDGASGRAAGELLPGVGEPSAECPGCYYTVGREVVIDAQRGLTATITYTPWPGKAGPEISIDTDPASGRAYYGLITGGYVHYSSVAAYPDLSAIENREPPLLQLDGLGGQIKLDPSGGRLYVARGDVLFILDSETLNRVGRVTTGGWTPVVAAVDGALGRLYLPRGSRLLVWTRSGGAPPIQLAAQSIAVTHTVASIQPSPNYAQDGTLLAQIDGRLSRSTDRGQTWRQLRGGLPVFADREPQVNAVFSPDYANDRRLFAGVSLLDTHGEGVYCSDDGGDTWRMCSDGLYDLRVYRVVPSPNYGRDRTLLAFARTAIGEALYRSLDGGNRWSLVLRQTAWGKPPLPRAEDILNQRASPPQFRCDWEGACERSDDGGDTWTPFDTGPVRLERFVGYALSPQYEQDTTVYILTGSDLYRGRGPLGDSHQTQAWSISTLPIFGGRELGTEWTYLAAAATGEDTHDLFLGSMAGEFYRFAASEVSWAPIAPAKDLPPATPPATPPSTPAPTPCVAAVDPRLPLPKGADLADLGCAVALGEETGAAFQPFERGRMFWREDLRLIYVLQEDGTWSGHEDTWTSDQDEPGLSPPQGLYAPVRGFGRVWTVALEGPPSAIGWATAPERGYAMVVQPFARGLLLSGAEGEVYALYDDGTWYQP